MDAKITDGNEVVFFGVNLRFIQSESNHRDTFAGGEWVVKGVTELGAPNRDNNFRNTLQDVLDTFQVA